MLEHLRQERLKRTEKTLKIMGCEKCKVCGYWIDKEYIKKGKCNLC